ncbi:type III secretion system export apparatus subunit SctT [Aquincola sp. S2]|uniref:Type III secretion system export apparatus subunit SctT n=1 Tax=Pseudaquabacterium terrae TaxID=2732868 RepID=A0ABX2EF38_9BURK|nr:type III secretion system export apparatus subunit SctT [Aquabacterium terrae]NRF67245.1 type III secretion system export apparatus subunit SctT [Aquabacterium terrae]
MEALTLVTPLRELVLLLGLSTTRVAVAFLLVPLFTADLIPSTVRNAMFLAIALMALVMQPAGGPVPAGFALMPLFAKEAFIGGALGFLFAGVMWAFEIGGQLIDSKVGTTQAQVMDPLSGHQTSLTGALFARLASWVFMAGGGFMVMMAALFESYALWPVLAPMPALAAGGARLFEAEFGRIMLLGLLVSAPALVLLYAVDVVLGLINRFAQQLNVFSLSMSLKAVAATWIVLIQLASLVQLLQDDLLGRGAVVLRTLRALFGG